MHANPYVAYLATLISLVAHLAQFAVETERQNSLLKVHAQSEQLSASVVPVPALATKQLKTF